MEKEEIKEIQKPFLAREKFKEEWFKLKGSSRSQLTEITQTKRIWLMENGQKVKLLSQTSNTNYESELLSEGTATNFNDQQKLYARKYVADTIIPSYDEGRTEAFGDKDLFENMIFNAIREQPIVFIGEILVELKRQFAPWCGELSESLLKKLEEFIVARYEKETPVNRDDFKNNFKTKFPNVKLLEKLK